MFCRRFLAGHHVTCASIGKGRKLAAYEQPRALDDACEYDLMDAESAKVSKRLE